MDGSGRAIGFALAPRQANELPMAPVLLSFLTAVALWIVADRGYSSHAFRMLIWSLGARPAIPTRRNEAPVACPPWIYQNRNRVERFWSRVKQWRALATRYEKTERSFMGVLCMAATMDWLRPEFDTCFYFIVSIQSSRRREIVVGTTFERFRWMVPS